MSELASVEGKCPGCGSPMAETGAPIWEEYCTNKECTYERERMLKEIRRASDVHRHHERLGKAAPDLLSALKAMVSLYVGLVESGYAGFWDAEKDKEVIAARAAIASAEGG